MGWTLPQDDGEDDPLLREDRPARGGGPEPQTGRQLPGGLQRENRLFLTAEKNLKYDIKLSKGEAATGGGRSQVRHQAVQGRGRHRRGSTPAQISTLLRRT